MTEIQRPHDPMITGHLGFLGNAMVKHVQDLYRKTRDAGEGPYPVVRFSGYDYPYHTLLTPDPYGPGSAKFDLEKWVELSDVVIHTAAVADLNVAEADPGKAARVNLEGTMNLAVTCARFGVPLIFISTCCVYGGHGKKETDVPMPTEPYAMGKLLTEHWLAGAAKTWGLRYRVARIATLYGPGMRPALFNWIALDDAIAGRGTKVHGNGGQTRQYLYIDDAVEGIWAIAERGKDGEVYNIAGSDVVTVNQTIMTARAVVGRNPVVDADRPVYMADRVGQIRDGAVDITKAAEELDWTPRFAYRDGMQKTLEWMLTPAGVALSAKHRKEHGV